MTDVPVSARRPRRSVVSLASANRVTVRVSYVCYENREKGPYSLLRSGIVRDDSNTRTDASIASYSPVAFDRYLVCYNRWDIDASPCPLAVRDALRRRFLCIFSHPRQKIIRKNASISMMMRYGGLSPRRAPLTQYLADSYK